VMHLDASAFKRVGIRFPLVAQEVGTCKSYSGYLSRLS